MRCRPDGGAQNSARGPERRRSPLTLVPRMRTHVDRLLPGQARDDAAGRSPYRPGRARHREDPRPRPSMEGAGISKAGAEFLMKLHQPMSGPHRVRDRLTAIRRTKQTPAITDPVDLPRARRERRRSDGRHRRRRRDVVEVEVPRSGTRSAPALRARSRALDLQARGEGRRVPRPERPWCAPAKEGYGRTSPATTPRSRDRNGKIMERRSVRPAQHAQ